ncbi:GDCCVxC domain-containing (seleno)protein [Pontibaca salina]|uniref:GDCCVxC domain-containing (seleno)protein n=1 Tax=Pontibaca salina TaxID=2795731 RepID=UPI001E343279|nr:GDCCVxC domain-containing (seleno)protein [Pontibaca salina]
MTNDGSETIRQTTLTCPSCGHAATETMPTDSCQWFYECAACHTVLRPREGDCCVYCSYATAPCPPVQEGKSCCR